MPRAPEISAVVPTCREVENHVAVSASIRPALAPSGSSYEVLVVGDHSWAGRRMLPRWLRDVGRQQPSTGSRLGA